MSIRKINFIQGEYYHIYNRGNSKKEIFHDIQDYNHFVDLLYVSNNIEKFNLYDLNRFSLKSVYDFDIKNKLVSIGAYCLMPNHFHILITEKIDSGISKFMQKVSTAYAMYYNKKYKRIGSLFEGKFKAQHVNNDRYLKYLFSYIHLNPVKLIQKDWKERGIKNKIETLKYLQEYKYSTYKDFLGKDRIQNKILNIQDFPNYFPNKKLFEREIFDWLKIDF